MKQMMGTIKQLHQTANPGQMMQMLANQYPEFNKLQSLANASGGDYHSAFFNLAKSKGYTPEQAPGMANEIYKYYTAIIKQ